MTFTAYIYGTYLFVTMIRLRFKKALLVASAIFEHPLLTNNHKITQVADLNRIFPSIHEIIPDVIIFDYEFMADEMESILRRIKANPFYSKIKICCYKTQPNLKTDDLLKTLGIDKFFYKINEVQSPQKERRVIKNLTQVVNAPLLKRVLSIS